MIRTNPIKLIRSWIEPNWSIYLSTQQPKLWFFSILIGFLVSLAAILFRLGIGGVQWFWLGTGGENIISAIRAAPPWLVVAAPTLGGVFVGAFLQYIHPIKRAEGVADVIEARARGGRGLRFWQALDSAAVTIVSLGAGASAGREGPHRASGCQSCQIPWSQAHDTGGRSKSAARLRGCQRGLGLLQCAHCRSAFRP